MIQVRVKKDNVFTHRGNFATQNDADEWINQNVALKSWGKPERWVDEDLCESQGEVIADAIAEQMTGGPDHEHKQYKFAAEYEIEQEDITAQLAQAETNSQSLKYLAETDWYVIRKAETNVDVPAEVLTLRAAARAAIVN
jgi:hypothetical protein